MFFDIIFYTNTTMLETIYFHKFHPLFVSLESSEAPSLESRSWRNAPWTRGIGGGYRCCNGYWYIVENYAHIWVHMSTNLQIIWYLNINSMVFSCFFDVIIRPALVVCPNLCRLFFWDGENPRNFQCFVTFSRRPIVGPLISYKTPKVENMGGQVCVGADRTCCG